MFWLKILFFLSGSAGLIYEIIWTRLFADIVGSTSLSMTAVFSVFLLSLAVGAQVFSRVNVYGKKALRFYAILEIAIACLALLTSLILIYGKSWLAIHLPRSDYYFLALFYKIVATILIIGAPALLMGGTLPVILNAAKGWTLPQKIVTQLYGLNTLGAACGSFATGFILIWKLGLSLTLCVAMSINLGVGLIAFWAASRMEDLPDPTAEEGSVSAQEPESNGSKREFLGWLFLAFFSGFTILGYEILWGRLAKFLLGDRTIAITVLLFIFISCLGISSLIAPLLGRWASTPKKSRKSIAIIFLVAGFLHLIFVTLARNTISGGGLNEMLSFSNYLVQQVMIMVVLIFPPILILGLTFPLLIWSAKELNQVPGKVVGNLYFINTIGATLGAIFSSYALCRFIGTFGGFFLLTLGMMFVGLAILVYDSSKRLPATVFSLIVLCGVIMSLTWFPKNLIEILPDERLLKAQEDEYGVQVLTLTSRKRMRVRNNRLSLIYDLGHPQTSHAQQMASHLTVLMAKDTKKILNIGTGYGITAGAFTVYEPQFITKIDTVEILPFLVQYQNEFAKYNFDYLKDSRVTLEQADGRHWLAISEETYDVLSVNVLDPYLPGSSALYTTDFWKLAYSKIRPGGVYTQLFWGKDKDLLIKGLKTVFPTVLYFPAYGNTSHNIVAFKEEKTAAEVKLHFERLGKKATEALAEIGYKNPKADFEKMVAQAWKDREKIEAPSKKIQGRLHTDDFPILEFRWSHGVEHVSIFQSPLASE